MSGLNRTLTSAEKRSIQLHLALIPLYVWLVFTWSGYFSSIMTPGRLDSGGIVKGHDFLHFYTLGEIAVERRPEELYSYDALAIRSDRLAGYEARYLPTHGPQMALLFLPMALMPYDIAWAAWALISVAVYGLACFLLWRSLPVLRPYAWPTFVAAAAYPPFAMLIGFGHISALCLLLFALAYIALQRDQKWWAGFALGSLFFKPTLGVLFPFVLLYGREWKMIGGAAAAVLLQVAAGAAYFGSGSVIEYLHNITKLGEFAPDLEPQTDAMQSLRSFFGVLLPSPRAGFIAYIVTSIPLIGLAAAVWRRPAPLELRYAVFVLTAILVNPHVNIYDLVVIVPVFVLVSGWALANGRLTAALAVCLYAAFYATIFAFFASSRTEVQISVLLHVTLLLMVARLSRSANMANHASVS